MSVKGLVQSLLLIALMVGFAISSPVQAATYTITDLGTLGGTYSWAQGLNEVGQVAGYSYTLGDTAHHAFLYSNGRMHDLSTLGGTYSWARALNEAGQVVGWSWTEGDRASQGFLYSNGTMTPLSLGGTYSWAEALNEAGQVVGNSNTPDDRASHAFLYSNGIMTDLGTLGGTYSWARALNEAGQVVGGATTAGDWAHHAFLYSNGTMTPLSLGGTYSWAEALNEAGQVVGGANTVGDWASHAFLYSNGRMHDLSTLGGTHSWAQGLNEAGQVVGWSWTEGNTSEQAFLYSNGTMIPLGTLGGTYSYVRDLNEAGQVIGYSWTAGDRASQGFLYSNGTMTPLSLGGTYSWAEALNEAGQVVGSSSTAGDTAWHPFLYSNGIVYDLNDLLPAGSGWLLEEARAINNAGEIVGFGYHNGVPRAFLMRPRPENREPMADAGPVQTVNEGTQVNLDGSASSDPEGDVLTYEWTQTGGPGVTLNLQDPVHPTFTAPAVGRDGEILTFELIVRDGESTSTPDTVTISVRNLNNLPVANAGIDQTVNEGAFVTLDGSGSSDSDRDALTYQWTQIGGPTVSLSSPTVAQPTFTAPPVQRGGATLTFQLTVNDGEKDSSPDTVDITVKDVNRTPVAQAEADSPVGEVAQVQLKGLNSYDEDNDTLTYSWTQPGGTLVTLSDPASSTPFFTAPIVGPLGEILTFELTVSDGLASATEAVDVVVENINHAPVAEAGPDQTMNEGTRVSLDGRASRDPDTDPLRFAWMQLSGPAVVLSDPHSAIPTFTAPPQPSHGQATLAFQLEVDDGLRATATDEVVITVLDVDAPPACHLAQANPALLWPPNHKLLAVGIGGVADPDNDPVTITVTGVTTDEPVKGLGDGDTTPDAVPQGATVLLRAERAGGGNGRMYQVRFTADDGYGGRCTGTVTVCVPHERKPGTCVDDGQQYEATQP